MRVDSGYVDLIIEVIEKDSVMEAIITDVPKDFALNTGESLEIFEEEVLYKADSE